MALVPPTTSDKKRVKVYELKNNDWFDRGTGFCTGRVIGVRNPCLSLQHSVQTHSVELPLCEHQGR